MLSRVRETPGVRRRMTGEDRREQILDVTRSIVAAEGFHAATPNRIADESGVTRPVLYQQFGDLAGLFVALVEREAARAVAQYVEAVTHPVDAGETDPFIRAFAGALEAVDAHPGTWRLFLFPPEGAPPELYRHLAASQGRVLEFLRAELEAAFPDQPDPEYTARIIHAAGRELLQLRITDPDHATRDRLIGLIRHLRTQLIFRDGRSPRTPRPPGP